MIKVNFDVALMQDGRVGIGCVGRDENDSVIWMVARLLRVPWDAFMEESAARCDGGKKSWLLGCDH